MKDSLISQITPIVKPTYNNNVISDLDFFSALYNIPINKYKNPVLVSGVDGVGTKICIAIHYKKYDIIGKDCFAMCINDVLCHGATPLFFLDYLACGKLDDKIFNQIIQGMAIACKETDTCMIGGETAEMKGFYKKNDYEVAGFCLGIVERHKIINGKKLIKDGDIIIGVPSSGVHSNGFSLIRSIFNTEYLLNKEFNQQPFYETLLVPTKIYYSSIQKLIKNFDIHGLVHITGGGIIANLLRILPQNILAIIYKNNIPIQPVFNYIQNQGKLSDQIMWKTFNMGVGMIIIASIQDQFSILNKLRSSGENPFVFGNILKGNKQVLIK
ncbi:phosphoribosylformylglycinamidine cyclo-ligase [Blattabacterium cuenoti]|uniref:phosphoribosylformylglycinamidine cyclo-ligase n=1 Tax=Blattabacterium cuenoti TaxID=1653831 RepID=UPI00163CB245|nr:phosphoribosylformylglycinamidine cyclo-ligase [Blattabacterium cuenoti]